MCSTSDVYTLFEISSFSSCLLHFNIEISNRSSSQVCIGSSETIQTKRMFDLISTEMFRFSFFFSLSSYSIYVAKVQTTTKKSHNIQLCTLNICINTHKSRLGFYFQIQPIQNVINSCTKKIIFIFKIILPLKRYSFFFFLQKRNFG